MSSILARVNAVILEKGYRLIKSIGWGDDDVTQADEAAPFGIDSSPLKDMVAVYLETGSADDPVIVGYLNSTQKAAPGEIRLFSKGADGKEKTFVWLKNNGTIEVGGDSDWMVRYSKLEEAFNQLRSDHNSLVAAFNSHMHPTAGTGSPSPPTPIPNAIPAQPSTADITPAKIDNVKTN